MFFIRSSLSSTRKLFRRTLQSVKSLFSERTTYQRLPKPPSFRQFSCQSYRDLDRFYSEFTNLWDNELAVEDNVVVSTSPKREILQNLEEFRDDRYRLIAYEEMLEKDVIERRCLVAEKLKELEMIDSNNLENARDIEEVLHLYSLLTCPVYIDMFDKFVTDMYSDIFNLKVSSDPKRNRVIS
ncbi:hypothetical protein DCAR_0830617 [Daucus carota subsp. sativus]|uniref:OVATE domain-containing protein n=1 Tax=Daucus carota subsp. sativus TaxID=79200 RepID=A0A175YJW7_DAUCS|nr:PREDICTED: uncharacterized protein LOC108199157 [Daucus carota subsp. sativus]WOH11138.1 hypothetical protein DCAR_0830617 [Daucus carota subsp. sativus]